MREYLDIAPTPVEEECEQVGTSHYDPIRARIECNIFKRQLQRHLQKKFSEIHTTLHVKSHPHDFGVYHSVAASYNPDQTDDSLKQALWLEAHTPEHWDEEALLELARFNDEHIGMK